MLLYDGLCGFCNGFVQFVLERDAGGTLRFAPLQGSFARAVLGRHAELAGVESLIFVDDPESATEKVYGRSTAFLRVARHLGGAWNIALIFAPVPRFIRDAAYDAGSRLRYRIFGRYGSCRIPASDSRARFILD